MTGVEMAMAAAAVMSAAVGTYSAVRQGQAAEAAADYNADVADQQALAVQQAAQLEVDRVNDRKRRLVATQRSAVAASGIDLEGSPLTVMEDTAAQAAFDGLVIKHQGTVEAARAKSQAALDRMSGQEAATGGYLKGGASFLNGASDLFYIYGNSQKPKAAGEAS